MKIRRFMQNGDLLQWHGNYPFSRMIRRATGEDENHSSQVVRLPFFENRVFSIEALDNGLHLWPLSDILANYDGWVNWYPIRPAYRGTAVNDATRWLLAHLGRGYDWGDCLSNWRSIFGMDPEPADEKYLYCSEAAFLSWAQRKYDKFFGNHIGAGLPHLGRIRIAPVPGRPVIEMIQVWSENFRERLVETTI